jgi:hypothetical protein
MKNLLFLAVLFQLSVSVVKAEVSTGDGDFLRVLLPDAVTSHNARCLDGRSAGRRRAAKKNSSAPSFCTTYCFLLSSLFPYPHASLRQEGEKTSRVSVHEEPCPTFLFLRVFNTHTHPRYPSLHISLSLASGCAYHLRAQCWKGEQSVKFCSIEAICA